MLSLHTDFVGNIFHYIWQQRSNDQHKPDRKVYRAVCKTVQSSEPFLHDTEDNHGKDHPDDVAFAACC